MTRVLIVDDDFRVASLHVSYAADAGCLVVGTAQTAAEALRLVASERPDLVLLDSYLPDRPGLDVAIALAGSTTDVLMVTADDSAETVHRALGAGAVNYLVKPFTSEQLRTRLVAYQRYRSRLATGTLSQDQIDTVSAVLHRADQRPTPKGQSPVTARLVRNHLAAAGEPVTASGLAADLGVGRATAQRYLAGLVDEGLATVQLRYGTTGRPEHEYRWSG